MPFLLVVLVALGAVGLYLALPGARSLPRAGALLLMGAAAALVTLLLQHIPGDGGAFVVLALIGVGSAVRVITHPKAVYSALFFILVVVAVAGLLVLMQAEFLAAALLIIYAGAILVTYVFVIMLAQQTEGPGSVERTSREPLAGSAAGFLLLAVLGTRLLGTGAASPAPGLLDAPAATGTVTAVGTALFTKFVVGVQIAGLLLLAAMVGALAIARRRPVSDALADES
jgi:NADH-quinone oxidoreductase subunit J